MKPGEKVRPPEMQVVLCQFGCKGQSKCEPTEKVRNLNLWVVVRPQARAYTGGKASMVHIGGEGMCQDPT